MYFILILMLFGSTARADVFRCERTDGSIYYHDRNCANDSDKQSKLITCIDKIAKPRTDTTNVKREEKAKKRRRKAMQKEAASHKRRAAKREKRRKKVKQEICTIHAEYRHGYSVKRGAMLDKKLVQLKQRQKELRNDT